MSPVMKIEKPYAYLFAALHLNEKCIPRFLKLLFFGMAQINKVTIVRNDRLHRKSKIFAILLKFANTLFCQWFCLPLPLIFSKEGKPGCPYLMCPQRCVFYTPCCTDMCSDILHE